MPSHKDFKRLVRARMQKTGESYTAARAHLIKNGEAAPRTAELRNLGTQEQVRDFATLAGMSDAAVKAGSGCTWGSWVAALDAVNAHEWPHRSIALRE